MKIINEYEVNDLFRCDKRLRDGDYTVGKYYVVCSVFDGEDSKYIRLSSNIKGSIHAFSSTFVTDTAESTHFVYVGELMLPAGEVHREGGS